MSRIWLTKLTSQNQALGFGYDLMWAGLAPFIAILLRNDFFLTTEEVAGTKVYVLISFLTSAIFFVLFSMQREMRQFTSASDVARITIAVSLSVIVTTFIVFVINRHIGVARSVPLIHFLMLLFFLLLSRVVTRFLHDKERSANAAYNADPSQASERVLVVGVNLVAEFYITAAQRLLDDTVEIVGIVSNDVSSHGKRLGSHPVLGHIKYLPHFLQEFSVRGIKVDKVVVCINDDELTLESRNVLRKLEQSGNVKVEFVNELLGMVKKQPVQEAQLSFSDIIPAEARPPINTELAIDLPLYHKIKRGIDLAVVVPMAIVSSPIMAALAIINRVGIGNPVLFWQERPGRSGQKFRVYKFRTMLTPYDADGNRIPDDLRQTQLTRFIRRTRLDELPQLYNILSGQMSLIGPRPLLPKDQPKGCNARLMIPPGVTGWAQVNGGEALTRNEKLAMDVWYVQHAGMWLDFKIILSTLRVIAKGDHRNDEAVLEATAELNSRFPNLRNHTKKLIRLDSFRPTKPLIPHQPA